MGIGLGDVGVAGLEIGGSLLQDRLNTRARHDAQDFSAGQFAHKYQTQVADLKAAGLNPMLAYMTGAGSAPQTSAASVQKPDVVGAVNQSRSNSAMVANVNADTMKKEAERRNVDMDTNVKWGMVDQVAAMTASAMASADQADAMTQQIRMSLPKIDVEIRRLESEIKKNKSDVELNKSLIDANAFRNSLVKAQTILEGQKAVVNAPRVEAYEAEKKRGTNALGKSAAAADLMQNFYRMINPFHKNFGGD